MIAGGTLLWEVDAESPPAEWQCGVITGDGRNADAEEGRRQHDAAAAAAVAAAAAPE